MEMNIVWTFLRDYLRALSVSLRGPALWKSSMSGFAVGSVFEVLLLLYAALVAVTEPTMGAFLTTLALSVLFVG